MTTYLLDTVVHRRKSSTQEVKAGELQSVRGQPEPQRETLLKNKTKQSNTANTEHSKKLFYNTVTFTVSTNWAYSYNSKHKRKINVERRQKKCKAHSREGEAKDEEP